MTFGTLYKLQNTYLFLGLDRTAALVNKGHDGGCNMY